MEIEEELPDGHAEGELNGDQLLMAELVAAARSGGAIRMGDEIERIIARDTLERPVSPPAQMPAPLTPKRSGPSGLNAHLPPFCPHVNSSDEDKPERQCGHLTVPTWSLTTVITSRKWTMILS